MKEKNTPASTAIETTDQQPDFNEAVAQRAADLSRQFNCDVHPLVFSGTADTMIVGYIKEPPRIVKMRALDKSLTSPSTAGAEVLEACLIREASDPRILSEAPENDVYYIGACLEAVSFVRRSVNLFKKK